MTKRTCSAWDYTRGRCGLKPGEPLPVECDQGYCWMGIEQMMDDGEGENE